MPGPAHSASPARSLVRRGVSLAAAGSALLLVLAVPPLACSSTYGEANDATDASASSDGVADVVSTDVTVPGADGGTVGEVGEAPCDANEVPPSTAIYVSDKTGTASVDGGVDVGTAQNPVKTIAAAIVLARSRASSSIVVDEGNYNEAIELDAYPTSLTISGAWVRTGASWARDCDKSRRLRTLVQSVKDYGASISGSPGATITLADMTIRSRESALTKDGEPGSSHYGVIVSNAVVVLSGMTIEATAGNDGGKALASVTGAPPCVASALACTAAPSAGQDAPLTPPAGPGGIAAGGYVAGNGQPGANGADGTTGKPGGAGATATCLLSCGNGGAAGCTAVTGSVTGGPGKCGCGGRGGAGGNAGLGGGASIGVFAASADVTIKFSEIASGNGGAGSAGAAGAVGEPGGAGVAGDPADCWASAPICTLGTCPTCGCYCKNNWNPSCSGPTPTKTTVPGGTAGGQGSPGGRGADGTGGSGGAAHAYATFGVSHIDISASKRTFGSGGTGAGGAPGGKASESP